MNEYFRWRNAEGLSYKYVQKVMHICKCIEWNMSRTRAQITVPSEKKSLKSRKMYSWAIKTLKYPHNIKAIVTTCSYERSILMLNRVKCYNQTYKPMSMLILHCVFTEVQPLTFIYAAEMHKVYMRDILFTHTVIWDICLVLGWINL